MVHQSCEDIKFQNAGSKRRRTAAAVSLIVLLGAALRLFLLLSQKSLWGDEWFSIELARLPFREILYVEIFTDTHPPVYPLLLAAWSRLFGSSEVVLRSLSTAAGTATVIASFFIGRELFGRRVGLLTAFFVAVSPYFVHLSNEIRSYSVLIFISACATAFFLKGIREPHRKIWKAGYLVFATAAIYTEHYGWLWLFGITLYLVYLLATDWQKHRSWVLVQAAVFIFGFGSVATLVHHSLHTERILDRGKLEPYRNWASLAKKTFGIYWRFICGPVYSMLTVERVAQLVKTSAAFWFSFLLAGSGTLLCLQSLLRMLRRARGLFVLFAGMCVFPVLFLLIVYPIRLDARYLSWSVPLFLSLLAYSAAALGRKAWAVALIGFFSVHALAADAYLVRIPTDPMHKEDYPGMVQYAFLNSGPNDAIGGLGTSSTYYADRIGFKPRGTYFDSRDDAIDAARGQAFERIWIMYYIDMDPDVTESLFRRLDARLNPSGYYRQAELMRFGGPDGLTAMQVYVRRNPDQAGQL